MSVHLRFLRVVVRTAAAAYISTHALGFNGSTTTTLSSSPTLLANSAAQGQCADGYCHMPSENCPTCPYPPDYYCPCASCGCDILNSTASWCWQCLYWTYDNPWASHFEDAMYDDDCQGVCIGPCGYEDVYICGGSGT